MANFAINFRNKLDDATLSGGSWLTALPLGNLIVQQPTTVARSTDLLAASTTFDADMGQPQKIETVAAIHHNATQSATWRIRIGDDPTFAVTTHDSGTINAWDSFETFGVLDWGVFSWGGHLSAAEAADFRPVAYYWIAGGAIGRYARIDFVDASNPAGYLDIGRFWLGPSFQPTINVQFGFAMGFIDPTTKARSRGSNLFVDPGVLYRTMGFTLSEMTETEAYTEVQELTRQRGLSKDVLSVLDPTDMLHRQRQMIYGQLASFDPVTHDFFDGHSSSFVIEELV